MQETIDEIATTMRLLAQQITSLHAKTFAGMRMRAIVISDLLLEEYESEGTTNELIISAMVRDLLSIEAA